MIVTKQRKSLHSPTPYTTAQKYTYSHHNQQHLSRNYRHQLQTTPTNYVRPQRHSLGTVSPIGKDRQKQFTSNNKKTDKKYDYSVNLQNSFDKQPLNRTHDHLNERIRYQPETQGQKYNVQFILDEYNRKRVASVTQSRSKNSYIDIKQNTTIKPPFTQSVMNSEQKQQKIDIKTYLNNYEPKYQSFQKLQQIKKQNLSKGPIDQYIRRPLMNQNFFQDNFGATDKFKQFSIQKRSKQIQEQKNKAKYEPKYAKMRNNKKYEINSKEPYGKYNETIQIGQSEKENQKQSKPIDFKQLLKDSCLQNSKITEKINRISRLNAQINQRLERMLQNKAVF